MKTKPKQKVKEKNVKKKKLYLIKRHGKVENFDERKLYASVYSACLASHLKKSEAENVASKLCTEIKKLLKNKPVVSSDEIFRTTIKLLKNQDKEVAFMYETHRDIS